MPRRITIDTELEPAYLLGHNEDHEFIMEPIDEYTEEPEEVAPVVEPPPVIEVPPPPVLSPPPPAVEPPPSATEYRNFRTLQTNHDRVNLESDFDLNLNGFHIGVIDIGALHTIRIRNGSFGHIRSANGAANIILEDLHGTGYHVGSSGFNGPFWLRTAMSLRAEGLTIRRVRVNAQSASNRDDGTDRYCLWLEDSTNVLVANCNFATAGVEAVMRMHDVNDVVVDTCTLRNNGIKHCFRVHSRSSNIILRNSRIERRGIYCATMGDDHVENLQIVDNHINTEFRAWQLNDHGGNLQSCYINGNTTTEPSDSLRQYWQVAQTRPDWEFGSNVWHPR